MRPVCFKCKLEMEAENDRVTLCRENEPNLIYTGIMYKCPACDNKIIGKCYLPVTPNVSSEYIVHNFK